MLLARGGADRTVADASDRGAVEDYARRKGVSLAQADRWLASNLDYDPE
ncbi:hypothetical protein [Lysobacter sp. Root494]|nr:hypothetical protein [Lysobacter sp. Root494]